MYNFDIDCVKGKNNIVVDALSCNPYLCSIASIFMEWINSIIAEYAKDPQTSDILEGNIPNEKYKVVEELILYKNRLLLAPSSKLKEKIIREHHDNLLVGHQGY